MIESKIGQRIAGLVLFLLGSGGTIWVWYTALTEWYYYPKATAIIPAVAVVGLSMLLFPMDMQKFRAEHGGDTPQKMADYPVQWKVMFVLALLVGIGNWLAMWW